MKLTILCDDTVASDRYLAEHGVSILVEPPNGHRWLLDTGTTDIFLRNAHRVGVSLDDLTGILISHGHDDHTGGLGFCGRLQGMPPVYGHPYIWHKQYEVTKGNPVRILGMSDLSRKYAAPLFRPVNGTAKLEDDLFFFTDISREPGSFAPTEGKFFNEDGTGPCPIIDDATLVERTPRGLVAIFGCAHAGYVNILKAVRSAFPGEGLLSVVGGLHLGSASEQVLAEAVAFTAAFKAEGFTFYGGHCTGGKTLAYFKEAFGDDTVKPLGAGRVIEY
ncbi:MBL fold metallo-hydrolase [Candidatus Deferrimicrobium sp.]|jgi:7,8-dihydropterin-6-yl-methyl-4-(beta-D-ribofuranosyl)aminobenzene 5'-phosphate synthase|uniref:MBL fold metallo-hydrolase n=1 Tax=Candidatus Deferrimicrobium sp. TaxID=3060586 RepID=UPI002ED985CC